LIEDNNNPESEARLFQHYHEWVKMVPQYLPAETPKEHIDYCADLDRLWADRYSIHLHVWEPNDWPAIINYLNQNGCPFQLVDYSYVFAPEDRNEFVLILRKEPVPVPLLPDRLPEKGPLRWFAARFLRRALFMNGFKNAIFSLSSKMFSHEMKNHNQ
jgi:hypothetical protein